ncbi:periplasmic substrate-binding domain-containing protein [Fodinicola feengrottensis]|uniref:hypothetical protein n=1 Tax=Fodinicola feengrottensis TaxID=435914 RepID=UPI0013D4FD94|nr:hypothetical protein [Fodinicola feengrottensis]
MKDGFARAGITVTANPIPRKQYYTTVGKPAVEDELVYVGWGADWPSASTVIPPLFDGAQIIPEGNQNYSQLNDPAINSKIYSIAKNPDSDDAQQPQWGDLDIAIQQTGATIPLRYEKAVYLVGSKVTGAHLHSEYSDVSLLKSVSHSRNLDKRPRCGAPAHRPAHHLWSAKVFSHRPQSRPSR